MIYHIKTKDEEIIMTEIINSIIICNDQIYFEGETVAEIRELSETDNYYSYRVDLEKIEETANDGNYHNLIELLKQVDALCSVYESESDSEFLENPDDYNDYSDDDSYI